MSRRWTLRAGRQGHISPDKSRTDGEVAVERQPEQDQEAHGSSSVMEVHDS